MVFQRFGFFAGLAFQAALVQVFYLRWMGAPNQQLSTATAPFLLTTINWFLLTLLGIKAEVADMTGINLPPMLFGVGCFFAGLIYSNIFQRVHAATVIGQGHPAMFLTLAPLSVASIAYAELNGGAFGNGSCGLLGLALVLFAFLMRSWPNLLKKPAVLGLYWAYVFPLCALASACIAHAQTMQSGGARALAWISVSIACIGFVIVFARMTFHWVQVWQGKESWGEPLLSKVAQKKASTDTRAVDAKASRNSVSCLVANLKDLIDDGECRGAVFGQRTGPIDSEAAFSPVLQADQGRGSAPSQSPSAARFGATSDAIVEDARGGDQTFEKE